MNPIVCGLLLVSIAGGLAAKPLCVENFDEGVGTWKVFTGEARLGTQDKVVKSGLALEVSFTPGNPPGLFGSPLAAPPAGARAVHLQLQAQRDTVVGVLLNETSGASYAAVVRCPAGVWQEVAISFDRFRLTKETKDPDGRLSADQIAVVAIMDISRMVPGAQPAAAQTLWVDDFWFETDDVPNAYSTNGKLPFLLDSFEAGYVSWVPVAGQLTHLPAKGLLGWRYAGTKPQPGSFPAMLSPLGPLPAKGAEHLLLTLRSERPAQLALALQEEARDGALEYRYYKTFEVPRSDDLRTVALPLREFALDTSNNPPDPKRPLALERVALLLMADFEVLMGQEPGANTVWLKEIQLQ